MTIIATTIVTIGTVTAFAGLIGHIIYFNILGKQLKSRLDLCRYYMYNTRIRNNNTNKGIKTMFNSANDIFEAIENEIEVVGMIVTTDCAINCFDSNVVENWDGLTVEIDHNNKIISVDSWG